MTNGILTSCHSVSAQINGACNFKGLVHMICYRYTFRLYQGGDYSFRLKSDDTQKDSDSEKRKCLRQRGAKQEVGLFPYCQRRNK